MIVILCLFKLYSSWGLCDRDESCSECEYVGKRPQ